MYIDAVDLVGKDECIMILPVLEFPSISGLVLVRGENLGKSKLDSVLDCGRMYDHEVDLESASGRNEAEVCGAVIKGDSGVEAVLRNTDNGHSVKDLELSVHAVLVCKDTGDLGFNACICLLGDIKDSALSRYFVVTHCLFSNIDESGNIGRSNGDVGFDKGNGGSILSKSVINLRSSSLHLNRPFGLLHIAMEMRLYLHPLIMWG